VRQRDDEERESLYRLKLLAERDSPG